MRILYENLERQCSMLGNLNTNLIDFLVYYEMLTALNQALRLIPFNKIANEEFIKYIQRVLSTIEYWMANVETSLENMLSAFEEIFLNEKALNAIRLVVDCLDVQGLEVYKNILIGMKNRIKKNNKSIDTFRRKIAEDARNFNEINNELPKIIKDNNAKILRYREEIKSLIPQITELTEFARKFMLGNGISIGSKPGIVGVISEENITEELDQEFFRFTIMVTFIEKTFIFRKVPQLKVDLINYARINSELYRLNKQAPILASVCAQVPNLYALAIKFQERAQAIKWVCDEIGFNLESLAGEVRNMQNFENLTNRTKRKLNENFERKLNEIKETIERFRRSISLGVPVDARIIRLNLPGGSNYSYSESKNRLLYIPVKDLHEIITNISIAY